MPNLEIASPPRAPKLPDNQPRVPFHTCIRLEDSSRARTSSIDAEWEALSAVPTECEVLPTVSARPRMETLPGIGTVDLPAPSVVPKPRRSAGSRLFISMLAATLTSSVAFVGMSAWQSHEPHSFAIAPAPVARVPQPHLAEAPSWSSPAPVALALQAPAIAGDAEPAPAKLTRQDQPQPRAVTTAARLGSEGPAPRTMPTRSYRVRKVALAPTDNPY